METLDYLKENINEKYLILYPVEELLVSLGNRDYPMFLFVAGNLNEMLEGKTNFLQLESVMPQLHAHLAREMDFIRVDVKTTAMEESDRELIGLYLDYYMHTDKSDIHKRIKSYLKSHPGTEYQSFLKTLKNSSTTGRMNLVLGYGSESLSGNISDVFDHSLQIMNFEVEGFVNGFYYSLFMGGNVNRLHSKTDLPVKKKDLVHKAGDRVSSLRYGIKFGKTLYSNETINFFPFVAIGGYEMNSQSDAFGEKDPKNPKNNLSGSFFAGAGASMDIRITGWDTKNEFGLPGILFVRPTIGYDHFLSGRQISQGSNFYYTVSLGIGWGSF